MPEPTAADALPVNAPVSASALDGNTPTASILVVDDEASIRESLEVLLSLENYAVKTAGNGEEGLRLLDQTSFDLILDCVSAPHDLNAYLDLLHLDGTLCLVGLSEKPLPVAPFSLTSFRVALAGSNIGGMKETQEMLDYCADHGIVSDIELTSIDKLAEAYQRVVKSDVKYRFVIDMATLKS